MSIPIIVAIAAGGALLFAGSAKKNGTPSPGGATDALDGAAKQSTSGDNGGATAPSHAGSESYNGGSEIAGAADVDATSSADGAYGLGYGDAGAIIADPVRDPWKPSAGASIDSKQQLDAVKAITTVGAVTGKAAVDSFRSVADAVGLIF